MDYLNRDSFFTGVSEGVIGYDRIIKMLTVHEGRADGAGKRHLFHRKILVARRLMYWQVYLHKTVVSAESMLVKIIQRAKEKIRGWRNTFFRISITGFFSFRNIRRTTSDILKLSVEWTIMISECIKKLDETSAIRYYPVLVPC